MSSSSRHTKFLNPYKLSFSNKLFILCSFLALVFPTLASTSRWIAARDDERVGQVSGCVWNQSRLPYSTFNLATGRTDFTSKLSLLKCNLRSILHEPSVLRPRQTRKKRGVSKYLLLRLLAVILTYAMILTALFATLLTLLVAVCTNGTNISDIFHLKDNPLLFVLTTVVFKKLECSHVTQAMSCLHSSQEAVASNYSRVCYHQVPNWNKESSTSVSGSSRPYAWTRRLVAMLLMLAGDVECNPGPPPPPVTDLCFSDTDQNHPVASSLLTSPTHTDHPVDSSLLTSPTHTDHPVDSSLTSPTHADHPVASSLLTSPTRTDYPVDSSLLTSPTHTDHPVDSSLTSPTHADHPVASSLTSPTHTDHPVASSLTSPTHADHPVASSLLTSPTHTDHSVDSSLTSLTHTDHSVDSSLTSPTHTDHSVDSLTTYPMEAKVKGNNASNKRSVSDNTEHIPLASGSLTAISECSDKEYEQLNKISSFVRIAPVSYSKLKATPEAELPVAVSPRDDGKETGYNSRRNQTITKRPPVHKSSSNIPTAPEEPKLRKSQTCPNFQGLTDVPTNHLNELTKRKEHRIPYIRHLSYPMCDEQVTERVVKQNSIEYSGDTICQEDPEYKKKLTMKVDAFIDDLREKKRWSECDGFLEIEDKKIKSLLPSKEEMGQFYLLTNQLYRARGECDVCLLCGRNKKSTEEMIDSHIFPNCLLKAYRDIHCNGESECIYDPSTKQKMGPKGLAIALFCSKCEADACQKEKLLRDLYITLVSDNDTSITVEDADWLTQISATLMFRGMLTGINVLNEILHERWTLVMEEMIRLQHYILGIGKLPQALSLYLLPNGPFNPNNTDPLFIYDYVLRCPSFTSVIQCEKKIFLYTKFDCFHWVLPLDKNNNRGLEEATNCFCMFSSGGKVQCQCSEDRKQTFPRLLLKVCALQSVKMEMTFLDNKCMKRYYGMVIQRYPGSSLTNTVPVPLHLQWSTSDVVSVKNIDFSRLDNTEEIIKDAQTLSPLCSDGSSEIGELKNDKRALEEKVKDMSNEQGKIKKESRKKSFDSKRNQKENQKLKQENEHLKQENEHLKQEIERLKAELSSKDSLSSIPVSQPELPTLEFQLSQEETRISKTPLKFQEAPLSQGPAITR